jgi:NPCBM/NEW2 domain
MISRRLAFRTAVAALALCAAVSAPSAQESKPSARKVSLTTVTDEQITAPLVGLRDGSLELATDPPRAVSLLDLQKLAFAETAGTGAQWVGQDGRDFVQVGSPQGGNGIADVHIRLVGLPAQKQIKQLKIVVRSPARAWRMDPTGSPDWRVAVDRVAPASRADIYFEPPAADLFEQELQLTITYADDTTDKLTCEATTHTNDETKAGSSGNSTGQKNPLALTANLEAGDMLLGKLAELTEETLAIETAWQPKFSVPLLAVQGIVFDQAKPEAKKRYAELRARPGSEDMAIVATKDGGMAEITGRVKAWDGAQLKILYEMKEQSIPADRLQALVFAAHPQTRSAADACQVARLTSGDVLSGNWKSMTAGQLTLELPWKAEARIPLESVAEIQTRNGNLVQLSDLEPSSVEQVPYFGRLMAWRADQSLDGGPLKIKGKSYTKGLAVHSRCVLAYPLAGQFSTFKTTVGFDEAAGDKGRVACRVLADGAELFAKPDLRPADGPQVLDLPVEGKKQLVLEVDFGADEDVGDRVIWAEPRLFRKK